MRTQKNESLISKIIKVIKDHFAEKREAFRLKKINVNSENPFDGIPLPTKEVD